MSVGMWATPIIVEWNDIAGSGDSFTQDGVTFTCSGANLDEYEKIFYGPGTFTTTLGNFTRIEVYVQDGCYFEGDGWSGDENQKTWTGNAASVSWGDGDAMIYAYGTSVTFVFNIEPAASPEPEPAGTVVTITENDFPSWDKTFTKDGVTVSAGYAIDGTEGNLMGGGSFSTTLGNFTKIEISAMGVFDLGGEGWSIVPGKATWTGNASSVSFTGDAMGGGQEVTLKFTIGESEPEPEPEPQPAGDEITVTWNDPSGYGFEFTQDGVTLTCGEIVYKDFYGTGTFTTDLGNFTKIEVYAESGCYFDGDGWSGDINQKTWTGNAASVSFSDDIYAPTSIVFTIEPAAAPEPENTEVNITPTVDPEHTTYYYSTFFDSQNKYELPAGVNAYLAKISDDALTLTKIADAGDVLPNNVAVIFRSTVANFTLTPSTGEAVTYNAADNSLQGTDVSMATPANCYVLSDEDNVISFYQYSASNLNAHKAYVIYTGSQSVAPRRMPFIFNEEQTATGMEEMESNVENRKVIENGQLIIIRDGVRYNAFGQVVE